MKLLRYTQFNESILSKATELINYKALAENDKIAQKYLDMIYKDYKEKGNLLAVKIIDNVIIYKLSKDNPYAEAGTSGGEFDYIDIKLSSLDETHGISAGTIRIEKSRPSKNIIGTDKKTGKPVEYIDGIDQKLHKDYINISKSLVDKTIKFFKEEYIKKYPTMKGEKYFNSMRIYEIDKELSDKVQKHSNNKREISKQKNEEKRNYIINNINEKSFYSKEDILNYFIDLREYFDENWKSNYGISKVLIDNGRAYNTFDILSKEVIDTNGVPLQESNKLLYALKFRIHNLPLDDDDYDLYFADSEPNPDMIRKNSTEQTKIIKEAKTIIEKTGLPDDLKIYEVGIATEGNPILKLFHSKHDFPNYQFIVLIEQLG